MTSTQGLINSLQCCIKRGSYISYKDFPEQVAQILDILKRDEKGSIDAICKKTGFKRSTLYGWKARLSQDPNFNPLDKKTNQNKRIFSDIEEDSMADFILDNTINPGYLFCDMDFQEFSMDVFLEKHQSSEKIPNFTASRGFVYRFKNRHRFSSRRCHLKRRPMITERVNLHFINNLKSIFTSRTFSPHYFLNADETSWQITPKNISVWHPRGRDHVVRYCKCNEKQVISVMAAIAADGSKLPLQFIAKGETEGCIASQIGDVYPHYATYSKNGWTTEETFITFLNIVREYYGFDDPNTITLVVDSYSAHKTIKVKETAHNLRIMLIYIPPGATDMFQPLDVGIFGQLKRFAAQLFRQRYKNDPEKERRKTDACSDLLCAWERVTPETIRKAFRRLRELDLEYSNMLSTYTAYEHWKHHVEASKLTKEERELKRIEMQN